MLVNNTLCWLFGVPGGARHEAPSHSPATKHLPTSGWQGTPTSTFKVCAFGFFHCGPLDPPMTHSFVHSTFFFFFWCLLCQVPALKELKAIQETYPRQPAESRALGKRWRPGKGRGSAERRGEVTTTGKLGWLHRMQPPCGQIFISSLSLNPGSSDLL